jgi:hypothetical protein
MLGLFQLHTRSIAKIEAIAGMGLLLFTTDLILVKFIIGDKETCPSSFLKCSSS